MRSTRILRPLGVLLFGVALASCAPSDAASARPRPKTHTVIMEGMAFRPSVITVSRGDTIVWVNKDLVPHSATSATAGFDSAVIQATQSWRHTVQQSGDFEYICSYHPTTMKAKLEVR
jgi:plastocyanin